MQITHDFSFDDLEMLCWNGGDALEYAKDAHKEDEFMSYLEGYFGGCTPTLADVVDFIWSYGEQIEKDLKIGDYADTEGRESEND